MTGPELWPGDTSVDRPIRELPLGNQLKYYSQFLYRFVFVYLLYLYLQYQGIAKGFLTPQQISAAMVVYISCTALVMYLAGGKRLGVTLQRTLVVIDLCAMVIGVPHDPHPGFPTIFVFYLVFADLGLRYRYRLYVEALMMGVIALALMVFLRTYYTEMGFTTLDAWQILLIVVIVMHGLQVFSGRDKAKKELQAAQQRLSLALQSAGTGAWSSDDPLHELKIDGHIRKFIGMEDEFPTNRMEDYVARIHPGDRTRVVTKYSLFIQSGSADYEDHYRVYRPNGEIRALDSRAKAIRNEKGRAVSVSGMVWDVTERKQQQEALERMEERYRLATHSAQVGVWIWHIESNRFEHDDAINHLLNLPDKARATNLEQVLAVLHPEDQAPFKERIEAALASKATSFFDEVRVPIGERDFKVIQSRATIFRDANGMAIRMAGANWDATQLARARKALEEKTLALEITNQELDDFTYVASHDLKEPLRGISSYAQYIEQDFGEELQVSVREMVARIREQAKRMETLINELLNIAKVGRTGLDKHEADLNETVSDILESLEFSIREKQIDIRTPRPFPKIECDRVRVGELYRNLLTNAMKYNDKPEPWIELGYEINDDVYRFYVRDNGIGIKPEHFTRVFTPFERLHRRNAYGGGTGVGLTIAQKTVQSHGGKIWLESVLGQGTTFYFTLQKARTS